MPNSTMKQSEALKFLNNMFTLTHILLTFTIVLSLLVAYQVIYNHFFHPLSNYPGPFFAGVTRIWIAWHNYIEDETEVCWKLVQKHGQYRSIFETKF